MVKVIEASTLEEALTLAAKELSCSVVDIDYEVIEEPKKGFFGIGRRLAKIAATHKGGATPPSAPPAVSPAPSTPPTPAKRESRPPQSAPLKEATPPASPKSAPLSHEAPVILVPEKPRIETTPIDNNFFKEPSDMERIAQEVEDEINLLFAHLPFKIERILVRPFDESTLFVEFKGEDSALLIGKEGYRYKAISYLLFNWINSRYGLMIRLEIAEFLKNQEEMIRHYLAPVVENIRKFGRAQTRPLDGVLAHIALRQLREEFPDKYVSFRLNNHGERYVIVNDFNR